MTSPEETVETKEQTSAGGVVFRDGDHLEICLIKPTGRTLWALPKGSVEAGETPEMAALREIREETGISGAAEASLGTIEYWFLSRTDNMRIHKQVHFYLVRALSGDTADHDHEVEQACWFGYEAALDVMTYPNERQVLRAGAALLAQAGQS